MQSSTFDKLVNLSRTERSSSENRPLLHEFKLADHVFFVFLSKMCWLTETFLNKRTLSKLSAVVAAHQNDWYCSIIQPICRIPITSSDKFDSLLIGFVNIAQLIQQFGSLQIKLVCRHISFQKWNIARGTTDPGYWLFNLSYLSSYSPRRNAKETGCTVQRCCRWGWKALGGTVTSAPTPN